MGKGTESIEPASFVKSVPESSTPPRQKPRNELPNGVVPVKQVDVEGVQEGILSVERYEPEPEMATLPSLTKQMGEALTKLDERANDLFDKIESVCTPGDIPAEEVKKSISDVSPTAKNIYEWVGHIKSLTHRIEQITEKVEL
jgi:hypothetical protein